MSREDLTDKVESLIATASGGRCGVKFKKLDEEVRSRLVLSRMVDAEGAREADREESGD